jgi:hypothetical protein
MILRYDLCHQNLIFMCILKIFMLLFIEEYLLTLTNHLEQNEMATEYYNLT